MTTKLEYLFNIIRNKSQKLRSKYKNRFDGQVFWQPIKSILNSIPIKASSWKPISKKIIDKLMLLPEHYKDGYGNEHIIESMHFLIQQVRIPTTEKPILRKIIQIALNIGQFLGFPDEAHHNGLCLVSEYKLYNLTSLSRYVTKTDIFNISKQIPDKKILQIEQYLSTQN